MSAPMTLRAPKRAAARGSFVLPLLCALTGLAGLTPCADALAATAPAPRSASVRAGAPRIEVAFVLDATGSMGPHIDDARSRIRSVAADLSAGEPRPDVRFALVAFRDKGDDFVTRITPFTGDVSVMHQALTVLSADGGGDTPEAVLEAVRDALTKLKWTPTPGASTSPARASSTDDVLRLVYLVGDAAPQHYADSPREDTLLRLALDKGIVIQSIICGDPGRDGRQFFERVAARSEGRAVSLADVARRAAAAETAETAETVGGHGTEATVGGTISGTTRTYAADMLRVNFAAAAGPPVPVAVLAAPALAVSGLSGPQLRHVTDALTFSDLWRAHTSLVAGDEPAPPVVDFSKLHVLVAGGADAGLVVSALRPDDGRGVRRAVVANGTPGVRFYTIPTGATAVAASALEE